MHHFLKLEKEYVTESENEFFRMFEKMFGSIYKKSIYKYKQKEYSEMISGIEKIIVSFQNSFF
jgi:hypothetical protein